MEMQAIETNWLERLREKAWTFFKRHSLPRWMVFLFDASALFLTFVFAYLLRFNFEPGMIHMPLVLRQSALILAVYCGFELVFRPFAGLIRHTTIKDIFGVFVTTTVSLILLSLLVLLNREYEWTTAFRIPLSIILIHYISVNAILFLVRVMIKMFYELVTFRPTNKKNVIIFGAGRMGVIVQRSIEADTNNKDHIVAFLDNNKLLQNNKLGGVPVMSPNKLDKAFLEKYRVATMIFAIQDIPPNEKSEILSFAVELGLEVLEVSAVKDWLNGNFELKQLKKIRVEDLLARDPIKMNMQMIAYGLQGKTIMVTGAAGSIGSEIVRQLTRFDIGQMILIDNAETPVFHLKSEMAEHYPQAQSKIILADVTDQVKMDGIFRTYKPQVVYHAAAYKHVPLMEDNPQEALRVNVGSTLLLTRLSQHYGVEKFVLVSTDKAVNPTNVMGASKRLCEMIVQGRIADRNNNNVQFVITRFGNVLGSNGSVIPIFQKQIEEGGPVKVTHPEITRYFMTIPEACQLVLEAGFMGHGGEIFIFDMGRPVRILDLAIKMIKLSGYEPYKDIKIEFSGLRSGEKLFEELLNHKEKTQPTYNPKVKVAHVSTLNHQWIISEVRSLLYSAPTLENRAIVEKLKVLVPEFSPSNADYQGSSKSGDSPESVEINTYPD
jgi:FlaA1/EpsC-like NDP-sugar epimerase